MKILLIQPPARDFYDTEQRLLPLGLCCLKAALNKYIPDVEVEVRDYRQGHGKRTVELPPELLDLREFFPHPDKSPFATFHNFYHFGAGFGEIAREVGEAKPGLVGISCMFSAYYGETVELAREIKSRLGVPIVTGGAHASSHPESLLDTGAIDYVIREEGELPLVELVKALMEEKDPSGVPNLAWRRGGRTILNPAGPNYPLEDLPPPDFSDFEPGRYRMGKLPLAPILASRGCPAGCSFCSVSSVFGRGYRKRPVDRIIGEMKALRDRGYRVFDFEDDNLTLDRKFFAELCEGIIAGFPEVPVLQAMNGISWSTLDGELLSLMKRAGFTHLNLALVSLDESSSCRAGRPFDPEKFREVALTGFSLGYRIVAYQILGLPGESLESMTETFGFLARLPVLMGASPFYLAPGSPMAEEYGPLGERDFVRCRLTAMGRDFGDFTRRDIFTLFVSARIANFLKGLPTGGREITLEEALETAEKSGGRSAAGARLLRRLLSEEALFAETPSGEKPIPRFDGPLFTRIVEKTGRVGTQDGGEITF